MKGLSLSFKNTFPMRTQLGPVGITFLSLSDTKLVAWYDFSDSTTMWENAAGSDPAEDGDRILKVDNKAYDGLGASSTSLNTAIIQPSLTTSRQPVWTAPSGLDPGFLSFTGTEWLGSSVSVGNASTGRMGGVTLNHENQTISFVMKNTNVTESTDHQYYAYQDQGRKISAIGIESTDDQMHYWPEYGTNNVDSGAAFTTNLDFWTIVMGNATISGADARVIKIYKNGVDLMATTVSYAAYNKDLTVNHASVTFDLGRSPGSANQFVGRMYEFLQWDKALSDVQLDQLNTYYGVKYGIS
tara:strand:+ start:1326 stop:2222 length:897 start_codon:yes stop_codon:yes gene_type:complete